MTYNENDMLARLYRKAGIRDKKQRQLRVRRQLRAYNSCRRYLKHISDNDPTARWLV